MRERTLMDWRYGVLRNAGEIHRLARRGEGELEKPDVLRQVMGM